MATDNLSSKFSNDFQNRMLAVAATQPFFLGMYQDVFKPGLFTSQYHRDFCSWISEFYTKYNLPPSKSSLRKILNEKIDKDSPLYKGYRTVLSLIYEIQVDDYEYIKDQIITASRFQSLKSAIIKMSDDLEAGNFDTLSPTLSNALKVGSGAGDIGMNFVTSVNPVLLKFGLLEESVQTDFKRLSRALGNYYSGELTVIVAPPNQGKTAFLGNLAFGAARYDQEVMYYTLEIGQERMLSRLYARSSQLPTKELFENIRRVRRSVRRFRVSTKGTVWVKFFPSRSISVETLKSHLAMVRGNDINPAAVFIDYADLIRPSNPKDPPPDRAKQIYEDLRALGDEFKVHVFTASQSRKSTLYASLIDMDDLSESWGKAQTADNVVPICQTREEKAAGVCRIFVAKARNETSGKYVHFKTKFQTLTVVETTKKEYKKIMRRAGFKIPDSGPKGLRKDNRNEDDEEMNKYGE